MMNTHSFTLLLVLTQWSLSRSENACIRGTCESATAEPIGSSSMLQVSVHATASQKRSTDCPKEAPTDPNDLLPKSACNGTSAKSALSLECYGSKCRKGSMGPQNLYENCKIYCASCDVNGCEEIHMYPRFKCKEGSAPSTCKTCSYCQSSSSLSLPAPALTLTPTLTPTPEPTQAPTPAPTDPTPAPTGILQVTNGYPGNYDTEGKFFGFTTANADEFFGTTSWHNKRFDVVANGKAAEIIVWKDSGNCKMNCGRWDDGTATGGQWNTDDQITKACPAPEPPPTPLTPARPATFGVGWCLVKIQGDTTGKCGSVPKNTWFGDANYGGKLGDAATYTTCTARGWESWCGTFAEYGIYPVSDSGCPRASSTKRVCAFGTFDLGLSVFSLPSADSPMIGTVPEGESFELTKILCDGSWAQVCNGLGISGFAESKHLQDCGGTASTWNRFGIGLVDPGGPASLAWVEKLAGPKGWALLILPDITDKTTGPDSTWVSAVSEAYRLGLNVVVRLGRPWADRWWHMTSDPTFRSYPELAAAIVAVVKGLPKPADRNLYVQVGNEVNLGYEFFCSGDVGSASPLAEAAAEYAALLRDVLDGLAELRDPFLRVAASPMAAGGNLDFHCGGSGDPGGAPGTAFMEAMHQAVPGIWQRVHWLSVHVYPSIDARNAQINVPFDQAYVGLHTFQLDLGVVKRSLQIMITETGWATHNGGMPHCTEQQKAQWTVQSLSDVFFSDARIAGVMPFMLANGMWGDQRGFGYVHADLQTTYPVFDAVRNLRLKTFNGN